MSMRLDVVHRHARGALLAALLGTTQTTACAPSLRVQTDYDREVRFETLHVYSWIDSTGETRDSSASPFLERRIQRAVDRRLADLGFEATVFGTPDFLVTAFVVGPARAETQWQSWVAAPCGPVVTFGIGIGYPYGYGVHHGPWHWTAPYYRQPWGYVCSYRMGFGYLWLPVYEEPGERIGGTLMIDMLDPTSKELLWRGSAEGAVHVSDGQAPSQEEVDAIVAQILGEFPPGGRR